MKYSKIVIIVLVLLIAGCKKESIPVPDKATNTGYVTFYTFSDYLPIKIYADGNLIGTITAKATSSKFSCSNTFGVNVALHPGQYSCYAIHESTGLTVDMSYSVIVEDGKCTGIEVFEP